MDRGDTGFVMHESFKDLKARRAEQEAYRKALEEQIMQKRKLQEQEREKYEGRKAHTPQRPIESPMLPSPRIQPPEAFGGKSLSLNIDTAHNTSIYGQCRPTSKGRILSFNEIDNFNEPHPAAVTPAQFEENFVQGTTNSTGIPEFSPECMKYLQQVMPGFTLPPLPTAPEEYKDSESTTSEHCIPKSEVENRATTNSNALYDPRTQKSCHDDHNQAFSSGTTSESSSVEDVQTQVKPKIHVSQTSEQLEGVKVSRKQYREELQKQIDERKRREDEIRRKAEEEEERIQEKIRIEQEKMQREYEEELRKQEEREKEAEKKRIATLAKRNEMIRSPKEPKPKCNNNSADPLSGQRDTLKGSEVMINPTTSEESIQSIGEFFDDTISPQGIKYADPDDRIIPVIAKKLREKSLHQEKWPEEESVQGGNDRVSLTARIDSVFADPTMIVPQDLGPPPLEPGLIREMVIRSAPCPPTTKPNDLEFFSTLKNYLQSEKSKIDERIEARVSKSTEKF